MTENNEKEIDYPQFLHVDPLYDNEQANRYQRIKQTTAQLQEISKYIENYIVTGKKFAQAVTDLHGVMSQIDIIAVNSQYSSLCGAIIAMNAILLSHLNHVESTMHVPVESFIRHDLSMVRKSKNAYFQIHDKFTESYDKLVLQPKKAKDTSDKRTKCMDLHRQSSHAFCEYILQLDVTESRYQNLVGSLLICYATSIFNELGTQIEKLFQLKTSDIQLVADNITKSNEEIAQKMLQNQDCHESVDNLVPVYYNNLDKPFSGTPKSEIQGNLWRKTSMFSPSSEKLFCMCRDGFFVASQSAATCAKPLWTLQLEYCNVKPLSMEDRPNCFSIISKNKNIILQAPSLYDRDKWVSTIQSQIATKFLISDAESARIKSNDTYICADCGAQDCDWLITNKGAIVCSKCAGIHRSLPNTISRIRSLTMDVNDIYCMELLKVIGNANMNKILEANVVDKINVNSTDEQRESFIRRKYLDLEFIDKEPIDLRKALQSSDCVQILKAVMTGQISEELPDGLSALQAASIVGSPPIVTMIAMNYPSMLNLVDGGGWTALDYATFYNHVYVVDALLSYGADADLDDAVKPYCIAASKRLDDIAFLLSAARPESFEKKEYIPPSIAFSPMEVDTSMFKLSNMKPSYIGDQQVSQPDPSSAQHRRRMTLTPTAKRPNLKGFL